MGPPWGAGCGCLAVSPQRWAHRPVVFRDQCLTPSTRGGSDTHFPLQGQGRAAQREVQGLAQSPRVLSCVPWPTGALRSRIGLGGALSLAGPPCSVSSGASRPLTQDLCPLWRPGLCGFAVGWRVDGLSGRQLLCRLERSLLADGGTSHAAPRVPSSLRHRGAFPPGRLRPWEAPACLPSSAPLLWTWRVSGGQGLWAPSHGNRERCALSPILTCQ